MLAITVVNVLFPTPPFWLEKAMNFVFFVVFIFILFLSFCFRELPAVLHEAGLSSLHTVQQSWYIPVCRACHQSCFHASKTDGLLAILIDGMPTVLPSYYPLCLPSGMLSCIPVFLQSCPPSFLIAIGNGCLQTGLRD